MALSLALLSFCLAVFNYVTDRVRNAITLSSACAPLVAVRFPVGSRNRPRIHERATLFERIAASVVAFYAAEDMHQGLFSRFALEACLVAGLLRLLRRFLIYWFYCVR